MPGEEKPLFASLVSSAPEENIVPFEEPDIVEFPPPPPKAPKGKGRAKNTATDDVQMMTLFSTWSPLILHSSARTVTNFGGAQRRRQCPCSNF